MVFKPDKATAVVYWILGILCLGAFCASMAVKSKLIVLSICCFMFLIVVWLLGFLNFGTSFILDENGCTVKFLFITKKYKWSDLKTVRVEDLRPPAEKGCAFDECIIFSTKENLPYFAHIRAFKNFNSVNFKMNTFAVYFIKYNEKGKQMGTWFSCWSCHKEDMLTKLGDWGVEPSFRLYNDSNKYEFINEVSYSNLIFSLRLYGSYLLMALILIILLIFK